MARPILAQVLRVAALACFIPIGAQAEPFKCPHIGGEFTFGQESNVNSLDQMISTTISTRNVAMNVFETLMTHDENNRPINDLAASMTEAPDHMSYTFKLRQGVKFHNGKPMSSACHEEMLRRHEAIRNLKDEVRGDCGHSPPFHAKRYVLLPMPSLTILPLGHRDRQFVTKMIGAAKISSGERTMLAERQLATDTVEKLQNQVPRDRLIRDAVPERNEVSWARLRALKSCR